jgi:hypothetical protein
MPGSRSERRSARSRQMDRGGGLEAVSLASDGDRSWVRCLTILGKSRVTHFSWQLFRTLNSSPRGKTFAKPLYGARSIISTYVVFRVLFIAVKATQFTDRDCYGAICKKTCGQTLASECCGGPNEWSNLIPSARDWSSHVMLLVTSSHAKRQRPRRLT